MPCPLPPDTLQRVRAFRGCPGWRPRGFRGSPPGLARPRPG